MDNVFFRIAQNQKKQIRRPPGIVVCSLSLEREAYELLKEFAPSQKGFGSFLSRLIYEHKARREEREKLRQEQDALAACTGERTI